jgi:hypothetical protein
VTLPERVVALHRALARGRIAHAFGGALALAYWTLEPRGTRDIDVNVFVPVSEAERVLGALPPEVQRPPGTTEAIARDGQVRLWWDDVPIDLFFDYVPIHAEAADHRQMVPFAGERIPVLGAIELAAFKVMFDRTRDWADIEAMIAAGTLDTAALRDALATMLPAEDHRFARLGAAEELAGRTA